MAQKTEGERVIMMKKNQIKSEEAKNKGDIYEKNCKMWQNPASMRKRDTKLKWDWKILMLAQIYNNTNNKLGNANNIYSLKRNDNKFYPVKRPTTRQINAKFIFIESLSRQAATSLKHNQINKNDAMKSKKTHTHRYVCQFS